MLQTKPLTMHPLGAESDAEVTRLLLLHRWLSSYFGGALPPKLDVSKVRRVLDVGCGIGAWAHEVAANNPRMHVIGVDTSEFCIQNAKRLAYNAKNVTFLQQDMHQLETVFQPNTFDLIHVRFLVGSVSVARFPLLIESLSRLCKKKGLLIFTEAELPFTGSSGCDHLITVLLSSLIAAQNAFSWGFSPQLGVASRLREWLRRSGSVLLHDDTAYPNIARGTEAYNHFVPQALLVAQQIRPLALRTGYATEAQLDEIFARMQEEFQEKRFQGACPLHTIVAINRLRKDPCLREYR